MKKFVILSLIFLLSLTSCSNQENAPNTDFIVSSRQNDRYKNVQSAIDAAYIQGGGLVKIEHGVYRENLHLKNGVDLWGDVGVADTKTCVIQGTHTPPINGSVTIRNIFLSNEKDIIKSEEVGASTIILIDCAIEVKDGYTFNLPNWKGAIVGFDLGEIESTNNGAIYNLKGANVFLTDLTMGSGDKNPMILSGPTEIFGCVIKPPVEFQKKASALIGGASLFQNTLTILDSASVESYGSVIISEKNPGIVSQSNSKSLFARTTINSSLGQPVQQDNEEKLELLDTLFINKQKE